MTVCCHKGQYCQWCHASRCKPQCAVCCYNVWNQQIQHVLSVVYLYTNMTLQTEHDSLDHMLCCKHILSLSLSLSLMWELHVFTDAEVVAVLHKTLSFPPSRSWRTLFFFTFGSELALFHGGALQEVGVCVSLEWDGGKEEGKRRMLNKIINSCHWRERQERESGKSQLWEPAVRVDHRRGKLASQRVSGKLLESFKLPVEIFTPPKKENLISDLHLDGCPSSADVMIKVPLWNFGFDQRWRPSHLTCFWPFHMSRFGDVLLKIGSCRARANQTAVLLSCPACQSNPQRSSWHG